ncbi:MAG: hypothetical protein JO235_20460 [Chroococcidiopsidaceae cyanobacterium CP_BM_RX_35]|nr:hypothetical protein [Chroococcidiopsidaceae cyanobacterium CP_BM_RX_35]
MQRFTKEIYAGVGKFATPPPTSDAYKYRLACSWRKSDKLAVGGVLYLGENDMIFVPHLANLPSDREPFTIVYAQDLSLQLVPQRLKGFNRLLVPRPPELLQISSLGGSRLFLVPTPKQVAARIRQVTGAA